MRTTSVIKTMLLILACSTTTAGAELQKVGLARRIFSDLTWDEVQTTVKTPKSICAAVRHNVRYIEDLDDAWASGKETWDRKTGDCEDFAACVVELCSAAGIEATVRIFSREGSWEGHAVVIGLWKGQLWIASNGWYRNVDSMDDAKLSIARELRWEHKNILVATPEEVTGRSIASSSPAR